MAALGFEVRARSVVNATGPHVDSIRRLEDAEAEPMLTASSGVHIILDERFSPPETGLLIPQTDDGRVLFLLPWQGATLVGTTDQPADVVFDPAATEGEIEYILRHLARYFAIPVARTDVKAAWSGLMKVPRSRPGSPATSIPHISSLSANHVSAP